MGQSKASPRKLRGKVLELRALELRLSGANYEEIAQACDVSTSGAHGAVMRALARLNDKISEKAGELKRLELERLNRLLLAVWTDAVSGTYSAIDRALAIMRRIDRLEGIEAPIAHSVDWRQEASDAGLEPSEVFEEMVASFVKARRANPSG